MSQFQPEGSTALRQGPDVQPIFSTSHIVYNESTLLYDPKKSPEHIKQGTFSVNAHEVVDILVRFDTFAGRYMYHCHILEHEDHDMMRPFVVMPAELMPFM